MGYTTVKSSVKQENRVKRQPMEWKEIFANHISDIPNLQRTYAVQYLKNNNLKMGKGLG